MDESTKYILLGVGILLLILILFASQGQINSDNSKGLISLDGLSGVDKSFTTTESANFLGERYIAPEDSVVGVSSSLLGVGSTTTNYYDTNISLIPIGEIYVSSTDENLGYILGKLVAGANISLTQQNIGGNEYLEISSSAIISESDPVFSAVSSDIVFDGNNVSRLVNDVNYQTYSDILGFGFLSSFSESDPLSLHLDQTSPQTFTAGDVSGTGLLNVTAGTLGLDTSTYLTSEADTLDSVTTRGATTTNVINVGGINDNAGGTPVLSINPNTRELTSANGSIVFDWSNVSNLRLNQYTTDGFLKTSSTNGTLVVDSSTYLTTETDPVYSGSEAFNIDSTDITNINNLSGVNTGDQNLNVTSGSFGFWDRNATSTTITPATANDTLDMTSGTTTITASNITGTATATIQYGDYSMEAYGYASAFRVYGYKDVGATRIFSPNYLQSNTVTDDSSESAYRVSLTFTDNSANFDGYRILEYSEYDGCDYDYYADVTTNSFIFNDGETTQLQPVVVTPNSVVGYLTDYPIVTNGLDVENITNDGNAPIFPDGLTSNGTTTLNGTNNLTGATNLQGRTRFTGGIVADTLYGINRLDIGVDGTYGNPRFNLEDYRPDATPVNTLWQIDNWYGSLRFLSQNENKITFSLDRTSLGYNSAIALFKDNATAGAVLYGGAHSSFNSSLEVGRVSAYNVTGMEKFNVYGNAWFERDNDKAIFGTGKDATIYYDGTNLRINPKAVGTGVVYVDGNVSATGFITRSIVADVNDGKSALSDLDNIESWLKPDGKGKKEIDYNSHYAGVSYQVTDFSKPVIVKKDVNECDAEAKNCKIKKVEETTYPYTKTEQGLNLETRVAEMEKMIWELNEKNEALELKLCYKDAFCVVNLGIEAVVKAIIK
jgi:hypothetical protein